MLSKFAILMASLSLWVSVNTYAADDNWFEVEIYIFSHQSKNFEQWPREVKLANTLNSIDMITPLISTDISGVNSGINACTSQDWVAKPEWCNQQIIKTSKAFPSNIPVEISSKSANGKIEDKNTLLMPSSKSEFGELIKRLTTKFNAQGLLHMTWQQNMLPKSQTKPIRILAGKDFSAQFQSDGTEIITNGNEINHLSILDSFVSQNQPLWQLDGTLEIFLNHYLYIDTDLVLRKEGLKTVIPPKVNSFGEINYNINKFDSSDPEATDLENQKISYPFLYAIHLTQNRRVRSDEIHYFDHPDLGMLIQIRKIKQ